MAETKTDKQTEQAAAPADLITIESLRESHPSNARAIYNQITNSMQLGSFSPDFIRGDGTIGLPDIDASNAEPSVKAAIAKILKEGKNK